MSMELEMKIRERIGTMLGNAAKKKYLNPLLQAEMHAYAAPIMREGITAIVNCGLQATIPKVIRETHPDLAEDEVEEMITQAKADLTYTPESLGKEHPDMEKHILRVTTPSFWGSYIASDWTMNAYSIEKLQQEQGIQGMCELLEVDLSSLEEGRLYLAAKKQEVVDYLLNISEEKGIETALTPEYVKYAIIRTFSSPLEYLGKNHEAMSEPVLEAMRVMGVPEEFIQEQNEAGMKLLEPVIEGLQEDIYDY